MCVCVCVCVCELCAKESIVSILKKSNFSTVNSMDQFLKDIMLRIF